jgi:Cys-tRNA(Pro)/Cys-tRNA(Cys) deacylase
MLTNNGRFFTLLIIFVKKMSTRAIKFLKQKGVSFEVKKYQHEEKGARFAAQAMDFPLEKTIKTLVVDLGHKGYVMVLMPGDKNIDLKKLSAVFSVKRAAMADTATAERLTGYLVGGISPFGTKQVLPVVMEECLLEFDRVAINAGQRGVMLVMAPKDILSALNGNSSTLAKTE